MTERSNDADEEMAQQDEQKAYCLFLLGLFSPVGYAVIMICFFVGVTSFCGTTKDNEMIEITDHPNKNDT